MKLFSNIKIQDIIFIGITVIVLVLGVYIHTNYPLAFVRHMYPVQAVFAKQSIKCSPNAPVFMHSVMLELINHQKSLNNQLAFMDNAGATHHCESGWEDGFLGEKPMTPDSRFRLASVSKIVTSAMVLQLINEKKIELDQPLLDIIDIPEPKDSRIKKITVRMLLEHSAGFDRFKTYTPMLTMGQKPWCPTNLQVLSETKLDFEPGTQTQYSNVGYCLLGAIVEKVTGTTFRQATNGYFQLDKKNIKFINNDFLSDEIKYDYRFEEYYGDNYVGHFDFKDSLSAVAGLSGSAKSVAHLTHELIQKEPLNIISGSHTPCAIYLIDGCYGYAMTIYQRRGQEFTLYDKSGFFPGVNTDVWVDSHGGILVVLRGASAPSDKVVSNLQDVVYDALYSHYSQ